MHEVDYQYDSEDMSSDELEIEPTVAREEIVSLPVEEEVLVVQAMDPGIAITRAINPTFQGQTLPASFRHYARMLLKNGYWLLSVKVTLTLLESYRMNKSDQLMIIVKQNFPDSSILCWTRYRRRFKTW